MRLRLQWKHPPEYLFHKLTVLRKKLSGSLKNSNSTGLICLCEPVMSFSSGKDQVRGTNSNNDRVAKGLQRRDVNLEYFTNKQQ